ncbi:DUF3775 domain-containing protein [Hyphococcus sp.]|uniref:DUF3775 domain-containing protein n=1 Tax=Hyphococcus sp. TaxID=2038636 RepID=UPI003CCBEB43
MILDPDTACALVYKIRRLHGKELAGPDVLASNDVDEGEPNSTRMDDALVDGQDDGNRAEIKGLLEGLESEQREEFAGLILLGREPESYDNLNMAKAAARQMSLPLMELIEDDPACAEHLMSGLERSGIKCNDREGASRMAS